MLAWLASASDPYDAQDRLRAETSARTLDEVARELASALASPELPAATRELAIGLIGGLIDDVEDLGLALSLVVHLGPSDAEPPTQRSPRSRAPSCGRPRSLASTRRSAQPPGARDSVATTLVTGSTCSSAPSARGRSSVASSRASWSSSSARILPLRRRSWSRAPRSSTATRRWSR